MLHSMEEIITGGFHEIYSISIAYSFIHSL